MSPFDLSIVLHYYLKATPHPLYASDPDIRSALNNLCHDNILRPISACPSGYRLTERGALFLAMLIETPYPIGGEWVDPRKQP